MRSLAACHSPFPSAGAEALSAAPLQGWGGRTLAFCPRPRPGLTLSEWVLVGRSPHTALPSQRLHPCLYSIALEDS
ncbi:hypothetical protein AAFF_G00285520 [Aldrovandia affinis]|uniref:Uncharacterized protein n=1 Tax=Aldrovandia affinis TaxID=143900 RepID=A0AAD7TAE9_9TELE|nr:hypothetical protein AAFF_G00285520 [Aldrovandia affinis]